MKSRLNKAFTLLEVLITVAILSTAIIFIYRAFTAALAAARFAQDLTLACYLAEDKLWEIEKANTLSAQPPESGTEQIQGKDFRWHYEISDTAEPDLKELNFGLFWKETAREKEYPLEILTYKR